jgi:hypothetical protein
MILRGIAGALLASVVLGTFADARRTTSAAERPRCTMSLFSRTRDSLTIYALARGTNDTVLAGGGIVALRFPEGFRQRLPPVYGQVFRIDTIEDVGDVALRRAMAASRSREIVIVPWDYDMGCGVYRWTRSTRWVTPDSLGLFSLNVRPESLWVGGRPTFDALYATIRTYADGPFTFGPHSGEMRNSDGASVTLRLPVRDVFALYGALPSGYEKLDAAARARIRNFLRANPHILTTFPGTAIAQGWER